MKTCWNTCANTWCAETILDVSKESFEMTCPLNWWSWKSVWWIKLALFYNCVSTLKRRGPLCFLFKRQCLETPFPSFSIVYKMLPNARSLSNTISRILSTKGVSKVLFFYIVRRRNDNKAGIFWGHFLRPVNHKTKTVICFVHVWYAVHIVIWDNRSRKDFWCQTNCRHSFHTRVLTHGELSTHNEDT